MNLPKIAQTTKQRPILTFLLPIVLAIASLALSTGPAEVAAKGNARPPAQDPSAEQVTHPLDPLTAVEYTQVLEILQAAGHVDEDSRYPLVTLQEPAKEFVLAWQAGDEIPRSAFAVVKQGEKTFEAVVNLTAAEVTSWTEIEGVQPSVLFEEFIGAQEIALADPTFQEALAERGITDLNTLFCAPLTIGYYALPEEEGQRLMKVPCFYTEGTTNNIFARPIEGLFALVDLNSKEVVQVVDTGVRPLPEETYQYDEESIGDLRDPLKPTTIDQPEGSNFTVEGRMVEWQNWSFHQRLDKRMGLVISQVSYLDGDKKRPILYQGGLSEIFVPYMDPDISWYWRTFMDSGEYGFGLFATPLTPGIDCPTTATFLGGTLPDDTGNPYPVEGVICIFERYAGNLAWRHFEGANGSYEGRPTVELVARMIATVGNYDYILDWIFTQDGRIRVAVGATGIDITKGVESASMADATAATDTAYGTLVAPNVVAPNHDHFFSFRLDLDVDGPANSFMRTQLKTVALEDQPRTSIWVAEPTMAHTESEAKLRINLAEPAMWHVMNENVPGPLGHAPGYMLMPMGSGIYSLLAEDDYPAQRAGFTQYNLWVTPYDPDELYAAGLYVNQSHGGGGLPEWTSADRSIENTDIVLWYTVGLRHVPRVEDWPVMPVTWHEFELLPFNFFERNPALDLRTPELLAGAGD